MADRRGGPGNFAGSSYQVQTQVRLALTWLADFRRNPVTTARISCEPRHLVPEGQFGYDIGLLNGDQPGAVDGVDELIEVKLQPTLEEVVELAARAGYLTANPPDRPTTLRLICAAATTAYTAMERLWRYAGEAGGDAAKFAELVEQAGRRDLTELYVALGEDPCAAATYLGRPRLCDREGTRELVKVLSETLAERGQVDNLVNRLVAVFTEGAETRRTVPGAELARDLEERGLLATAPVVDYSDVDVKIVEAMVVLQHCEVPLPVDVLAEGLDIPREALDALLAEHEQLDIVVREDSTFWLAPRDQSFPMTYAEDALVRTLGALNRRAEKQRAEMAAQTMNAVSLARACADLNRRTVAFTFKAFDKASKAWGDLWTVYELAEISTAALASLLETDLTSAQTSEYAAWRAQTYICGQGWVLQRVDDLAQAMTYMEQAQRISERYHDNENEAFALKCEGRIRRLQAEALDVEDPERSRLLEQSADLLREAKPRFDDLLRENSRFYGDRGECVSLLARTVTTTGDLAGGKELVSQAHTLLDSIPTSKAYADLVILEAEIDVLESADQLPATEAIAGGGDADATRAVALSHQVDCLTALIEEQGATTERFDRASNEITARARVVLGSIHELLGDHEAAHQAYIAAVAQYDRLRCHIGRRDEAAWMARILTQPPVPAALAAALDEANAPDGARLRATDDYFDLWTPAGTGSRMAGSGSEPDSDAIRSLVSQAIDKHTASQSRWGEGRVSA